MKSLHTVNLAEIKEVWESFSGWYWFVTEYHEETIAFGLVRGWETEWGYFDLDELRELAAEFKVWQVPPNHWAYCPCVETDAVSCSGKPGVLLPAGCLGDQELKGGGLNMEENKKLEVNPSDAPKVERLDSIMMRPTLSGNGFKVVHNGIWYYASKRKVLDMINRARDKCVFVTIEDEAAPVQ
jgi:hypothetical protein